MKNKVNSKEPTQQKLASSKTISNLSQKQTTEKK